VIAENSGKITVLLAEDNPHVSALLQTALEGFADVMPVNDGADALLRAVEQRPDMVVADFTLPGLDGLRLLEKLRGRPSTKDVAFVLMAPRSDIEQLALATREMADEVVEKPFLLADAVGAVRRVIAKIELQRALRSSASAATESAGSGHMRGTLSQLSLVDLLQALELGGKTCRVVLSYQQQHCQVFVDKGAVVQAECGKQHGDEAVFAALAWPEGEFELDFTAKLSGKKNIERSTQSLLIDGLRILDESRRDDVLGDL